MRSSRAQPMFQNQDPIWSKKSLVLCFGIEISGQRELIAGDGAFQSRTRCVDSVAL